MHSADCPSVLRAHETMLSFPQRRVLIPVFVVTALLVYAVEIQLGYGSRLFKAVRTMSVNSSAGEHDNRALGITNSSSTTPHRSKNRNCESIYDLSNDVITSPSSAMPNVLDAMHACGLKPRLLSRAVSRSVDNDTSHVVPNIVHYIWYTVPIKGISFEFEHYLSFRSASQFLKPDYIFLHGNIVPEGEWWARTVAEVDNLYHVYREKPTTIYDKKVVFVQHLADVTRLRVTIGEQVFNLLLGPT